MGSVLISSLLQLTFGVLREYNILAVCIKLVVEMHTLQHGVSSNDTLIPHVGQVRNQLLLQAVSGEFSTMLADKDERLFRQLDLRKNRVGFHEMVPEQKEVLFLLRDIRQLTELLYTIRIVSRVFFRS